VLKIENRAHEIRNAHMLFIPLLLYRQQQPEHPVTGYRLSQLALLFVS
jgi:hypothetical protein